MNSPIWLFEALGRALAGEVAGVLALYVGVNRLAESLAAALGCPKPEGWVSAEAELLAPGLHPEAPPERFFFGVRVPSESSCDSPSPAMRVACDAGDAEMQLARDGLWSDAKEASWTGGAMTEQNTLYLVKSRSQLMSADSMRNETYEWQRTVQPWDRGIAGGANELRSMPTTQALVNAYLRSGDRAATPSYAKHCK